MQVTFGEYTYTFSPDKNAWYCDDGDIMSTSDIVEAIRSDAANMASEAQ